MTLSQKQKEVIRLLQQTGGVLFRTITDKCSIEVFNGIHEVEHADADFLIEKGLIKRSSSPNKIVSLYSLTNAGRTINVDI